MTNRKAARMYSPSRAIVHHLLASHLRLDDASIDDAHRFDQLRLDPLDLVLVVLRLEDHDRGRGDFPVGALAHARTVGDLVTLVDLWLSPEPSPEPSRETTPCATESATPPRRSVR
jgi:acyl carrier protein